MAEVFLAHDSALDRRVALKVFTAGVVAGMEGADFMRRESRHSLTLSHENIVRIHDFHQPEEGPPFITMEYVDGGTLAQIREIQTAGIFAWDKLVPIVTQVCEALSFAHKRGIVHLDIKPGNIMVDGGGIVKVADFGISASFKDTVTQLTTQVTGIGTPPFMSPQQLIGNKALPADDLYALGATLYELLTGTPPFHRGDLPYQIREIEPESITDRLVELGKQNSVPAYVDRAIMQCLAKEAAQRPESVDALAAQLKLQVTIRTIHTVGDAPVSRGGSFQRWHWIVGLTAVIATALYLFIVTDWKDEAVEDARLALPIRSKSSKPAFIELEGYRSLVPGGSDVLTAYTVEHDVDSEEISSGRLSPEDVPEYWGVTNGILVGTVTANSNLTQLAILDLGESKADRFVLGFSYELERFGRGDTNRMDAQLLYAGKPANSRRQRLDMIPFDGIAIRLAGQKELGGFQFWGPGAIAHVPVKLKPQQPFPDLPEDLHLDQLEAGLRDSKLVRSGGSWAIIVKQNQQLIHIWNGERILLIGSSYFEARAKGRQSLFMPFFEASSGHLVPVVSVLAGMGTRRLKLEGLYFREF